jgi:tetratricopeptide (TPR) repeat protein
MTLERLFPFLLLMLFAGEARAADRALALKQFQRGNQHYKLGEYKEALAIFKDAFRNYEDPAFLFNIAQCERLLDQRESAIREYKMYLAESPSADNRDEVRALIARLESELAAQRAGAVHAATSPSAASAPTIAATAPALITSPPPPRNDRKPAYKKAWVWVTVAGIVVAGAATGLAVGLTRGNAASSSTTLGTVHPF